MPIQTQEAFRMPRRQDQKRTSHAIVKTLNIEGPKEHQKLQGTSMKPYVKMTPSNKSKFATETLKVYGMIYFKFSKTIYCLHYYRQPRLVYSAKPCFIIEERKTCHDKYKLRRIVGGTYTLNGDKHSHRGIGKINHSRMVISKRENLQQTLY